VRIHHLKIENFRGIREMNWFPSPGINCLVGPGDATKTGVVDAISVLLADRWNLQFSDADFFGGTPDDPIVIEATLTDLPGSLFDVDVFGQRLRGVMPDRTVVDDPVDGSAAAITIRLEVDAALEPRWFVVKDSDPDPVNIRQTQRDALSVQRLDDTGEHHLRWSRSSALSRITASAPDLPLILANAQRTARTAVFDNPSEELTAAANQAAEAARRHGAFDFVQPRAGLDPALFLRSGALVLHDGIMPSNTLGLGSRRLLALAVQREAISAAGILIADEVEAGLEPHRLRMLLAGLRELAVEGRQIFLTTHSPIVLENLDVTDLKVVRSQDGATTAASVPPEIGATNTAAWQALARSAPSSLLAEKIVVGEGATEAGMCWSILDRLGQDSGVPSSLYGVAVMNGGGGTTAPGKATMLARLGFTVLLVVDNDPGTPAADVEAARASGCAIIRWDEGNCLEMQVAADVDVAILQDMVDAAIEINETADSQGAIWGSISARLPTQPPASAWPALTIGAWVEAFGSAEVRSAIGLAASKNGWFKREFKGGRLGHVIYPCLGSAPTTHLATAIQTLSAFVVEQSDD